MTHYEREKQVVDVALAGLRAWEEVVSRNLPNESIPTLEYFTKFSRYLLRDTDQ